MKALLIVSLLLLTIISARPCFAQDGSELSVLDFSSSRYLGMLLNTDPVWDESPQSQWRYERERRTMEKNYGDLIRSHELRKAEREAARSAIRPSEIFKYKLKVENKSTKTTKALFWEYQIVESASPDNITRRQFFCVAKIKTNARRDLEVFSGAPPAAKVVSAKTLGDESIKPFEEKAVITRVEYTDGSSWQRSDWSFPFPEAAALSTAKRDIHEPACRGL